MTGHERRQLDQYMAHLEENWTNLEQLFTDIDRDGLWDQPHGPDWTFADLPYHLAYCNRDIVLRSLQAGPDLPGADQLLLRSLDAINDWNTGKFAERPTDQTPAHSLAEWRGTCAELRAAAAGMADEDLERPFFMILMTGWNTARDGFEFIRAHDMGEFLQLRYHMGRRDPVPSAGLTRAYLQRMLSFYPMLLNRSAAEGRTFSAVMAFTDPGVGAFTLQVKDNSAIFKVGDTPGADLVMTQTAETFMKTLNGKHDPAAAMQSGEIQVNDFGALAAFGELFMIG